MSSPMRAQRTPTPQDESQPVGGTPRQQSQTPTSNTTRSVAGTPGSSVSTRQGKSIFFTELLSNDNISFQLITYREYSLTSRSLTGTPQRRSGNNVIETPLRWGNRRTHETIAPSSEGHSSVPLSSPSRLAQTSPLAAGMSEIELSSPLNYGTPSSLASVRTPRSGIRGTPMRQRPDIQSDKRIRQVNLAETVS